MDYKILVTGATGFIGSYIIECLRQKGYIVTGCCRTCLNQENNKYIVCDLVKEIPEAEADVIIHTAALSPSVNAVFNDYFENNVMAVRNIIKYAKLHNVKRIIYLGAVSSYGEVKGVLKENSPHNNPGFYGLTKYVAEQLIRGSGIPYYILILPGVVGKGCRDNWIMNTARLLTKNEDLYYYNGKGLFNNIVEVEDLCRFIIKLLCKDEEISEAYLLGSRDFLTVEQIVLFLKNKLGSNSRLFCSSEKKNSFYLDINKALSEGYEPKPIEKILDRVELLLGNVNV